MGESIVRWAARVYGPRYEPLEVANTAVELLMNPAVVASVNRAEDRWAYLSAVLKKALIAQIGPFFRDGDLDDIAERVAAPSKDTLTPMVQAIEMTTDCLRLYSPKELIPHLEELVYYFAERGHSNLSYLHSDAARDPELLSRGLKPNVIRAVANAVLGSRPDHGEKSILGGFILDDAFDPRMSLAHKSVLSKYATRVLARDTARELVAS